VRLFVCKCQLLHTHLCVASNIGLCPHMENPRLSRGIFIYSSWGFIKPSPRTSSVVSIIRKASESISNTV